MSRSYRKWWSLHVKRVRHQFFSPLQISSQYEWVALHPGDDGFGLSGELCGQQADTCLDVTTVPRWLDVDGGPSVA